MSNDAQYLKEIASKFRMYSTKLNLYCNKTMYIHSTILMYYVVTILCERGWQNMPLPENKYYNETNYTRS